MRAIFAAIMLGAIAPAIPAGTVSQYEEVWLTGKMIFAGRNGLLFLADQPVEGNRTGRFITVRIAKEARNLLLPIYMKAVERHASLRLYGHLVPESSHKSSTSPTIQFVTWKAHLPSDPDDWPMHDTIIFGSDDTLPGYKVQTSEGSNQEMEPTASRRTAHSSDD
jgi:hypothetical protein